MFGLGKWDAALNAIGKQGPRVFTQLVSRGEESDTLGAIYPRNKTSDDATVVFVELATDEPKRPESVEKHRSE